MYEEIQQHFPLEFALRDQDKYRYRYPKGEVSVPTLLAPQWSTSRKSESLLINEACVMASLPQWCRYPFFKF